MSVDRVGLSYDPRAPSQADSLQAQYFERVLAVELAELTADLATHTVLLSHAQLANDHWRTQYEHRQIHTLEVEQHRVTAMLQAIANRYPGVVNE